MDEARGETHELAHTEPEKSFVTVLSKRRILPHPP